MKILKDILTGKDNATHDVVRVIMVVNTSILVIVFAVGVITYIMGWYIGKTFDIQTLFTSSLTYVGGISALITSGSAAIYFKRSTEPDGSIWEEESITKGKQPEDSTTFVTPTIIEQNR